MIDVSDECLECDEVVPQSRLYCKQHEKRDKQVINSKMVDAVLKGIYHDSAKQHEFLTINGQIERSINAEIEPIHSNSGNRFKAKVRYIK